MIFRNSLLDNQYSVPLYARRSYFVLLATVSRDTFLRTPHALHRVDKGATDSVSLHILSFDPDWYFFYYTIKTTIVIAVVFQFLPYLQSAYLHDSMHA